jgi:hypothetical protein
MRKYGRIGGELVDPEVSVQDRKQLAELLGAWLQDLSDRVRQIDGYSQDAGNDERFVLHGSTIPADLTGAELHRSMVGADLHIPQVHKQSHVDGGDSFLATDLLQAIVRRLQESSGPTTLLMGAVADGQFLRRSGTAIIGGTAGSGNTVFSYYASDATPQTVLALNTWYPWELWALHGTDDLPAAPASLTSPLRYVVSAGTWDVRVYDATGTAMLVEWIGLTSATPVVVKETTEAAANWPSVGTNDIQVQVRQTAGTAGVDTISVAALHIMLKPPVAALGGFSSPQRLVGMAA